jgi:hypothetical protein
MISESGHNLSVLIVTETDRDWQTYASWYSIHKNLPDAKISLFIHRNEKTPFVYYQWAKRLKIQTIRSWPFSKEGPEELNWLGAIKIAKERNAISDRILVIRPHVLALESFQPKILKQFNESDILINEDAWFFNKQDTNELINKYYLEDKKPEISLTKFCLEAKENNETTTFVCYKKGCGRWIDTAKGCPFSNAAGLVSNEMTVNETRIIEIWKKMVPLYHVVV